LLNQQLKLYTYFFCHICITSTGHTRCPFPGFQSREEPIDKSETRDSGDRKTNTAFKSDSTHLTPFPLRHNMLVPYSTIRIHLIFARFQNMQLGNDHHDSRAQRHGTARVIPPSFHESPSRSNLPSVGFHLPLCGNLQVLVCGLNGIPMFPVPEIEKVDIEFGRIRGYGC